MGAMWVGEVQPIRRLNEVRSWRPEQLPAQLPKSLAKGPSQ